MGVLSGKRILLGVTGSIAAYRGAELARALIRRGAHVQVAMTRAAQAFITPLTFHALTSRPVLTGVLELGARVEEGLAPRPQANEGESGHAGGEGRRSGIEHVEQAHALDLVVVAPASANTLARFAAGFADDALSAIVLATRAPVLLAPAMETGMWENAATVENVARLRARHFRFVGPDAGDLASGRSGMGRLAAVEAIVEACTESLAASGRAADLAGLEVLITAGPTWEAIDPVRVLSNRSTGSMGLEIARAAVGRGARVTLVLGPSQLPVPAGAEVVRVESAEEMLAAARTVLPRADALIAAAAVSDFRPEAPQLAKLKRQNAGARTLTLVENPDVLATLALALETRQGKPAVIVGFAAETEDLERNAAEKLARKRCDLVIANLVGKAAGFGPEATRVLAVRTPAFGPPVPFGPASKADVAQFVLDQVLCVRKQKIPG